MESHPWPARANCDDIEADAHALAFKVNGSSRPLKPLPEPDHFPVVVGVRMSLSFPILLSAIPLYRFSTAQSTAAAARTRFQSVEQEAAMRERSDCMERMYFTDGGICSNLPVHLFDSPLPKWPTFAINLRDDFSDKEPASARVVPAGRGLKYQHDQYDIAWKSPTAATVSFGLAILSTMQNWRDALQRGAAGFRERVFTIRHTEQEGGLNLDMQIDPINRMAKSGTEVADRIREAFRPKVGQPTSKDDWLYHRWVRIRLLLPVLEEYFAKFDDATRNDPNQPTVFELLADSHQYLGDSFDLNPASRAAADRWLRELDRALTEVRDAKADLATDSPRPGGTLRVTPTY
jgi:predicted acylesterase/phospholipase RssA